MATGKTDLPIPKLDTEQLVQLEARLAAERERRNAEWTRERIEAGRVVRLITEPGEGASDAIARRRAEHPEEDCLYLLRVVYDAPPPRPDLPPAPVVSVPHPWPDEPEPSGPIVYPRTGWL